MPSSTCLIIEAQNTRRKLRPYIVKHAACFEIVEAHSVVEGERLLRDMSGLGMIVVDVVVPRWREFLIAARQRFASIPIVVVGSEAKIPEATCTTATPDSAAFIEVLQQCSPKKQRERDRLVS